VLHAAIALADEQGIESLTMRNLAEVLGVEAMSLYYHVANKEAVLDGVVDAIVAEIEQAVGGFTVPRDELDRAEAVMEKIVAEVDAGLLVAFADLVDNADLAESFLKFIVTTVLDERADDMAFFNQRIDKTVLDVDGDGPGGTADARAAARTGHAADGPTAGRRRRRA
jgi:AcrR family transcriptional regulator